jgi:tRNA-dihydrouridine synthase
MDLLDRIERHLQKSGVKATSFGRAAVNDPGLVRQMRSGRQPKAPTVARLEAFLDAAEREREASGCAK